MTDLAGSDPLDCVHYRSALLLIVQVSRQVLGIQRSQPLLRTVTIVSAVRLRP